jgi:hypothetical protein
MLLREKYSVTNEIVPEGHIPEWLKEHIRWQAISPNSMPEERKNKIMIIYPSEESRVQSLSELSIEGFAFDRKLHQTINSLLITLMADFRFPKLLPVKEEFSIILHEECRKAAKNLLFPIINPIPEMEWGRGKTSALATLHEYLSNENAVESWNGPGLATFRKILENLEQKTGRTHPDMAIKRIIDKLSHPDKPFSLIDIEGIIMLNHPPSMPKSHQELLLSVSNHCPIHQLVYPGNFRLGHHGFLLIDKHPIKYSEEIPNWLPLHDIKIKKQQPNVSRYIIQREDHSFNSAISLTQQFLEKDSKSTVIIIDPSLDSNTSRWKRLVENIGLSIKDNNKSITSDSYGHWLKQLITIGHGANSFSLESLRTIAIQKILSPFESDIIHPTNPEIVPIPDLQLLTNLARSEHVLGGPGALRRWLESLARTPNSENDEIKKESTQWWLLNLAKSLQMLLREEDILVLKEKKLLTGCHSKIILPLHKSSINGDKWILNRFKSSRESMNSEYMGNSVGKALVIQTLLASHHELRNMQSNLKQNYPKSGSDWVEEYLTLMNSVSLPDNQLKSNSRLRILTPEQAIGCSADKIILANLSSSSWDMRVSKLPFMGEEERHKLNLLRPDGPIRKARHFLKHLLFSGKETIILDPSLDDASPPTAPIREWILSNENLEELTLDLNPASPRDIRQLDGNKLMKGIKTNHSPINPSSISIPFDIQLQRERERRQPDIVGENHYLSFDSRDHIFYVNDSDLSRKTPPGITMPREFSSWPVIGGTTEGGKRTPTIDPRPFTPIPTGVDVSDLRHGHGTGVAQDVAIWSASRLHDWLKCPRSGWLNRSLSADQEELQSEDLDLRTHGNLLHFIHHDILCHILDMKIGKEFDSVNDRREHISIGNSNLSKNDVMKIALESLDSRAPWLDRTDAVSVHRLQVLTGMNRDEYNDWLANPIPVEPQGRIGTIIEAEFSISDGMPIGIEWDIGDYDGNGIELDIPSDITSPDMRKLPSIKVRGQIDRVDQLPFDKDSKIWINKDGDNSIAPLKLTNTDWKPKRLIIIRDLKTSESKSSKDRHNIGLLEELQLAIYARAWEIAHPGDLVVGVGISLFSHNTTHNLEISNLFQHINHLDIGIISRITKDLYRFPNENNNPSSDQFRAWLTHRLSVTLGVANNATLGKVHPTPSKKVCSYCSVKQICDVKAEDDF